VSLRDRLGAKIGQIGVGHKDRASPSTRAAPDPFTVVRQNGAVC